MIKEDFVFLPLGGSGEIGMNMNLYGYGDPKNRQWLIVDCGITFAGNEAPGIDLVLPDHRFAIENKKNIIGMVLTHAHEDHIGALAYLWPDLKVPMYATPFTAKMIEGKFADLGIDASSYLFVMPLETRFLLGIFELEFLSITHSIPETSALVVKTPLGTVFHTADWKFDDDPIIGIISNKKRIAEIGDMGVLACVCDSTNAMDKGKTGSEADILEPLTKEIIKAKGRVAITTFASNAGRLKTILRAVRDSGRQAVLCGRSMDRIFNIGREMGFFNEIPDPITMKQAIETEKNKIAYICTGSQGEGRAALWRIAGGGHPLPLEAGDTVIFSSKTIPGNEKDVSRLQNVLSERGVLIITSKDAHIHVSGHPAQDDLTEMYKLVRPEIAVPVHGEARHMLVHSQLAHKIGIQKSIVPKNGMVVKLAPHGPQAINMVDVGRLYVDGNLIDADNNATHERRRAMFSGVVHIGLILENGDFASEPAIFTFGVPNLETYKGQSHKDVLSEIIFHAFYNMDDHENVKEEVITETVRLAVRRHLNQYWGKKPHVEVSILYVNAPKFAKKKKAKKVQLIK